MFGLKKKAYLSLELNDYVLRILTKSGQEDNEWQLLEIPVPAYIMEDANIVDEMGLYDLMKEKLHKVTSKHQPVRIFVPDTSVLLKTFEHPPTVKQEELLGYVQMELGRTIHLPFQDPLVDVYDPVPNDGHATMFAVPPEEVGKLVGILQDVGLSPEVADIRSLCNLRFLEDIGHIDDSKTYLIADWSINELSICIYSNGNMEFLRFQSINTDLKDWVAHENGQEVDYSYNGELENYMRQITDQVLEIDRISNFFRFSLHKGEKSVEEIVMMGDNPYLHDISNIIRENIAIDIQVIDDAFVQQHFPQFKAKHASLIGLALKEV